MIRSSNLVMLYQQDLERRMLVFFLRNIHNFAGAICLSDFWNTAVKTCQETVFPGSKAEKSCCSIVWTSEYQIHAVYLTTNSNQLKIDKKINAIAFFLFLPFKSIFKVTNIFFIHIALITNFYHEYSLIFVLILSIRKFLFHRLDHSSLRKMIKILR